MVGDVSRELVRALRPLVAKIRRRDRALADQLVRAASSVSLNIFEADYSDPGNKRSRLFTASGSANETLATDWNYLTADEAKPVEALLDRVIAMLWKLTH
jgi:four helix bundle protein